MPKELEKRLTTRSLAGHLNYTIAIEVKCDRSCPTLPAATFFLAEKADRNAPRVLARLDESEPTEKRWNAALAKAYVAYLHGRGRHRPAIHTRLNAIERVFSVIAPDADRSFFARSLKKISRQGDTDDKLKRIRPSNDLRDLGISLMKEAQIMNRVEIKTQRRYRTGLQIALLALRPLRLKNFAALEIGKHIKVNNSGNYSIFIPARETKTYE